MVRCAVPDGAKRAALPLLPNSVACSNTRGPGLRR